MNSRLLSLALVACCPFAHAQPVATPREWVVARQHSEASDQNPGTIARPLATISAAAAVAQPGDTVLVHAGVYRERVAPARGGESNRPITYAAVPGERVVVKGSDLWRPRWEPDPAAPGVYSAPLDLPMRGTYDPFRTKQLRLPDKTLGQVFVDGVRLNEAPSLPELARVPGTWHFTATDNRLRVHFPSGATPPAQREVEVTTRDRIFAPHVRGLGHIIVRGFVFEHAANQFPSGFWERNPATTYPQAGAVGTRSGHHWIIEHNVIRLAQSVGLDIGVEGGRDPEGDAPRPETPGGSHIVRDNDISDNGACGIAGYQARESVIVGNRIERNNFLGHSAPETGGIKIHGLLQGRVEGNLCRDNMCDGIWLDTGYDGAVVRRNVLLGNKGAGIFIELGAGPIVLDHNICAFNNDGVYAHDASGITLAHNLLYANTHFGFYTRTVTDRGMPRGGGSSRHRVLNNIFVDNYRGAICFPFPDERGRDNLSDYNLFVGGTQSQWEGQGYNQFALSLNDGPAKVAPALLVEAFRAALERAGVLADERPNLKLWIEDPALNLRFWRLLTGQDAHSAAPPPRSAKIENGAVAKGSWLVSPLDASMRIREAAALVSLACPPVSGLTHDFDGVPLAADAVRPGPFQSFPRGEATHLLWPPASSLSVSTNGLEPPPRPVALPTTR